MILYYLLLLSLAFSDQRFFDHRLMGVTVEKYLGGLVLLYALVYLAARKSQVRLWSSWQARAFTFFFALAALSWIVLGRGTFRGSMLLVYLSELAFLISTLILIDSTKRLRWSLLAILASVAWASLYSLREWEKAVPLYGLGYRPVWNPAGDPNYLAASAVVCLPIAFYLFMRSPNRFDRWFSVACVVPIVGAMLVGSSRGGLLALIAAGVVILFQSRMRRGTLLFIGGIFALLFLVSPVSPLGRLLHPGTSGVAAENNRLELWSAGFRMIVAHPLMGIGLGNFEAEVPAYLAPGQHIDFIAHNTYIQTASEMGLPGLAIFLWILFATFKSLARTRRQAWESDSPILYCAASGLFAGLVGFSVAMVFLSAGFLKLLWCAVFFAAAIEPLAESTAQEHSSMKETCEGVCPQTLEAEPSDLGRFPLDGSPGPGQIWQAGRKAGMDG